jgi:beta-lactamase superfamily II metal-dependent hydrolase
MAKMDESKNEKTPKKESSTVFQILFLYMGQGDCTLVRCPDGKFVMIDCGSKAYFDPAFVKIAQEIVRDEKRWGEQIKIDALILTHPDRDHYSEIQTILGQFPEPKVVKKKKKDPKKKEEDKKDESKESKEVRTLVEVKSVYFSGRHDSPLAAYRESGISNYLKEKKLKTSNLYEVTINEKKSELKTWEESDWFETPNPKEPTTIPNKTLTVISGKTDSGKTWSVSIIAGNVPSRRMVDSDIINTASLVTLLQYDTSKALICGDATEETEAFLLKQHKELIKDVDLLQVPHHGSLTSSGEAFVKRTNPEVAVVSVGDMESSHRLPRYTALDRWLNILDAKSLVAKHDIEYWIADEDVVNEQEAAKAKGDDPPEKKIAAEVLKFWESMKDEGYDIWDDARKDAEAKKKEYTPPKDRKLSKMCWLFPIQQVNAPYALILNFQLFRESLRLPLWQTSSLTPKEKFLEFELPLSGLG